MLKKKMHLPKKTIGDAYLEDLQPICDCHKNRMKSLDPSRSLLDFSICARCPLYILSDGTGEIAGCLKRFAQLKHHGLSDAIRSQYIINLHYDENNYNEFAAKYAPILNTIIEYGEHEKTLDALYDADDLIQRERHDRYENHDRRYDLRKSDNSRKDK